jgi:diketogulonate reductase-like aldo/keto reductase
MDPVRLPGGETVPALGMGTWMMGEDHARRPAETAAIRLGVDLGLTLVDTAEMYGEGRTEAFLGEALAGLRDRVFLVSKVYPHNASRQGVRRACEGSLGRLRTDRLDLYLLHWRGREPLEETVAGFEDLRAAGKIRHWGVSNFDTGDLEELFARAGGERCAVNQVLYNLTRRGPEWDLLPWMDARRMPLMAYSPLEQGRLPAGGALGQIAARLGATPWQVALAWVLRRPGTLAIPKASRAEHLRRNHAALGLTLTGEDLGQLEAQFVRPQRKSPLQML